MHSVAFASKHLTNENNSELEELEELEASRQPDSQHG